MAKRGAIKRGSNAARREKYRVYDRALEQRRARAPRCPFKGAMAEGWRMYHEGKPQPHDDGSHGKSHAASQGWIKAKLAAEQGKPSL